VMCATAMVCLYRLATRFGTLFFSIFAALLFSIRSKRNLFRMRLYLRVVLLNRVVNSFKEYIVCFLTLMYSKAWACWVLTVFFTCSRYDTLRYDTLRYDTFFF